MTRRGWLLLCSSGLCVAAATVTGAAVFMRRNRPASRDVSAEDELLQLINAERARFKYQPVPQSISIRVPPLREDETLQQVALGQAKVMGQNRAKVPISEDQLNQELKAGGYPYAYWATVPDMVYRLNLSDAVATWMDEEKHKKTKELLLNPNFADVGIGVYRDGTADAYYVFLLLAKKK